MIIVGGRQSGKSGKLVEWVKQGNQVIWYPYWDRVIVTPNESQASYLRITYQLDYRQVFSLSDWRNRHRSYGESNIPEIAIDNADMILASYVGAYQLATLTDVGGELK